MSFPRAAAPTSLSATESQKRAAAQVAADLVSDGERVGLGSGSTVAYLLPALAARGLNLRCAATSPATERAARELGLVVEELDELGRLDIAIDGADQIDPLGWLVKGGGGAHTHEKIVAVRAERFVVIASADKLVTSLRPPIPLEILRFGARTTLASLGEAALRDAPPSPEDNQIADYLGAVEDPHTLSARLSGTPGVVDHGLFAPELVSDIVIASSDGIEHRNMTAKGRHHG